MSIGRGGIQRGERDFRWRGRGVTRLEGLSDAVFALALVLTFVPSHAPRGSDGPAALFAGALGLAALAGCWCFLFRFQRRFGLRDGWTTLFSLMFLFGLLLWIQPLRTVIGRLTSSLLGGAGGPASLPMLAFGSGFAALFLLLAALNARAWRLRAELELDSVERVLTKSELHSHLATATVGLASAAVVLAAPESSGFAGWIYCALGPLHAAHRWSTGRAVGRYRGKVPGAPRAM